LETASAAAAAAHHHLLKLAVERKRLVKLEKSPKPPAKSGKKTQDSEEDSEEDLGESSDLDMADDSELMPKVKPTKTISKAVSPDEAIAILQSKLGSTNAAASAVINHVKKYIKTTVLKLNSADLERLKRDAALANTQMDKLSTLLLAAKRKVTAGKSTLKLASESKIVRAKLLAHQRLKTSEDDLVKVEAAMRKIRARREADNAKLAEYTRNSKAGAAAERAVSTFAKNILGMWEKVKGHATTAVKAVNSERNHELEERMRKLEAALKAAHLQLRRQACGKRADHWKQQISIAKVKLGQAEERMSVLHQLYANAKKKKDKHNMIKSGAAERDLSVEKAKLNKHLKFLQNKMATAHDCHGKLDQESGPAGSKENLKTTDLSAQLSKVQKAVAAAKVASKKRADEKKKLTEAEKQEKTKLKVASKAKKDLQAKMKQVDGMQAKLQKEAVKLKKQQAAASTKQKLVATKLQSAQASISKLQSATKAAKHA